MLNFSIFLLNLIMINYYYYYYTLLTFQPHVWVYDWTDAEVYLYRMLEKIRDKNKTWIWGNKKLHDNILMRLYVPSTCIIQYSRMSPKHDDWLQMCVRSWTVWTRVWSTWSQTGQPGMTKGSTCWNGSDPENYSDSGHTYTYCPIYTEDGHRTQCEAKCVWNV